jgi:hypothetical protein
MRPSPPHRKMAVSDGAILVAATAIGFAWYRSVDREVVTVQLSGMLPRTFRVGEVVSTLLADLNFCWPMAFVWSIAGFLLRLRRPRPSLPRLMCQPGSIAFCSVVVVAAFLVLPFWVVSLLQGPTPAFSPWDHLTFDWENANTIGLAVTTAWFTSALGGRWRPERNWLDRMGRVLGVYWVILALSSLGLRLWNEIG